MQRNRALRFELLAGYADMRGLLSNSCRITPSQPLLQGLENPTACSISKLVWQLIEAGLPSNHGLKHLKVGAQRARTFADAASQARAGAVVFAQVHIAEHDASVAEFSRALLSSEQVDEFSLTARGRCMIAHSFRGEQVLSKGKQNSP